MTSHDDTTDAPPAPGYDLERSSGAWGMVPRAVLAHPDLTLSAKVVYATLATYAGPDRSCWPGERRLAEMLDLSHRTVQRAVHDLRAAGLLGYTERRREDGSQTSNLYVLHDTGVVPPRQECRPPHDTAVVPPTTRASSHEANHVTTPDEAPSSSAAIAADAADLTDARELAHLLAAAIAEWRNHHGAGGGAPRVTDRWVKDMDLLMRRGPLGQATPEPIDKARLARAIDRLFTGPVLSVPSGSGNFCWAAQVQSPQALRKHWHRIAGAASRDGRSGRAVRERATHDEAAQLLASMTGGAR